MGQGHTSTRTTTEIIHQLSSHKTMVNTSTICTNKTGTLTQNTGCIEGFSEAEKHMENLMKTKNPSSKFCGLKSVMVKNFLLCHSLFPSLTTATLFKPQNLLMEFVVFIAFSICFSASENPFMHPVKSHEPHCWFNHYLCEIHLQSQGQQGPHQWAWSGAGPTLGARCNQGHWRTQSWLSPPQKIKQYSSEPSITSVRFSMSLSGPTEEWLIRFLTTREQQEGSYCG